MHIHFIAIGGSAMHGLAVELKKKGYSVSGSDDEIFEPSRSRLAQSGLLPVKAGWFPEKITAGLDAVILGMHARADNPELNKAQELGIRIYSYPEFLYEQSKNKKRVVVAGSHGKTTITGMIIHALKHSGQDFDYMIGAPLEGFESTIRLSESAPLMILEGDEYLSSAIDRKPKFLHYHPHIAIISGIAWDHINVFPTCEKYLEPFRNFTGTIEKDGLLIWCRDDLQLQQLGEAGYEHFKKNPYGIHPHTIENGCTYLITGNNETQKMELLIFGDHNLYNISAAQACCRELGISDEIFYSAIGTFKGAANRLQRLADKNNITVIKDFAHAPSKVKATLAAVKKQFPGKKIIACLELHTYSSLNEKFLPQYAHTLRDADVAMVYYNPHTFEIKKLPMLDAVKVRASFARHDLLVLNKSDEVKEEIINMKSINSVMLFMTSGNFNGINLEEFAGNVVGG